MIQLSQEAGIESSMGSDTSMHSFQAQAGKDVNHVR